MRLIYVNEIGSDYKGIDDISERENDDIVKPFFVLEKR